MKYFPRKQSWLYPTTPFLNSNRKFGDYWKEYPVAATVFVHVPFKITSSRNATRENKKSVEFICEWDKIQLIIAENRTAEEKLLELIFIPGKEIRKSCRVISAGNKQLRKSVVYQMTRHFQKVIRGKFQEHAVSVPSPESRRLSIP